MCAVIFLAQANPNHPFVDQPSILSGAEMVRSVVSAWEDVVIECAAAARQPSLDAGASPLKELELHGAAGLLLHHRGPRSDPTATDKIADPNFDDVAAPQLTVDGKVEQSPVTKPSVTVQPEPY